ncbi:fringe glycosyltransferase [Eupeodes corollae]|uniref:fringe glycosyltransferase n=1 Tax=Eupeodes corollae TaxID=290404 RepID=UPI00248F6C5A|nr:fringe glycosyltransferase [Eupeodes corollae]
MSITLSLPQRYKRILQAMTLAVVIVYSTLVLYQTAYGYPGPGIQLSSQELRLESSHSHYAHDAPRSSESNSISSSSAELSKSSLSSSLVRSGSAAAAVAAQYDLQTVQPQQPESESDQDQDQDQDQEPRHNMQLKLLQFQPSASASSTSRQQKQRQQSPPSIAPAPAPIPPQPPYNLANQQQTTVIIRKDILSFNFSDIEVSERPSILDDIERRGRNGELLHDLSQRAVTATPKPPITELDDIFISVKTTKNYHDTRLALIIKTWFQLARDQTWFFTDTDDAYYQEKTKGHLINTNCSIGHFRKALCCKMSAELDVFLESGKKWFCHFDDDNYVNVPRLVRLLDEYSPSVDWYLGKPSISSPLEIHLDNKNSSLPTNKKITFWFATGGAGFCLSRALTLKMLPIAGGGKFISIGDKIRFPDDVTMGFIIEHLLKVPLTVVDNFHSHLEPMEFIRQDTFHDQVSFSYARMKNEWNVVKVDGFDLKTDPKRFYSLHCNLFPYFSFCRPR